MPVAAIVAGVATVGAAVVSSNAARSAARQSAQAVQASSDANIAFALEERNRNEELFAPYLGDENKAKAFADALTYGSGTYPGPNNTTITVTREQVQQQIAGTPLAQMAETAYADRETLANQSYADENTQAQSSYAGARSNAERDLNARNTDAGARRADTENIAGQGYGEAMTEADRVRAERQGQAQTGLNDRYGEADSAYGARTSEAGRARTDRETAAGNARTALRGVADENYSNTLTLAEQDYLRRQGFTDAEITAWEAKALDAKDKAINAAASRLGVSGQTGRATRTIADTEQNYARDRALYEGDRRRADYDPYSAARLNADAQRGDTYLQAERGYADGMGRAVESYAGDMSRAIDQRTGARTDAYNQYDADLEALVNYYNGDRNAALAALQAQRQAASQNYYSDRSTAYDQYSEADQSAYGAMSEAQRLALLRRNSTRASNTDQRAGDRATSYAAFTDDLSGRQSRGYGARANIASAGQAYADTAINQNNRAADAAAASYARQDAINQQLYSDIAGAAGSVWGAITNKKGK